MSARYKVDVYPVNYSGEVRSLVADLRSQGVRHTVEPSGEFSRVTFMIERDAAVGRVRDEIKHWLFSLHSEHGRQPWRHDLPPLRREPGLT